MKHWDQDPNPNDNFIVKQVKRFTPITTEYHKTKLFVRIDGKRFATPMFLVMVAIGSTDLLFALDSIPATFGVTQQPYLVFTANAFALLGLRALYFLLKGLLDKLVYLSIGLALILVFIGIKLIITYVHEIDKDIPKVPTGISLGVIAAIIIIAVIASLIKVKKDPTAKAHAGTVRAPKEDTETSN